MASFGALQNQQKQTVIDASNDVKQQYSDIFTNNEELYNLQAGNRAKYMSYLDDKESYLHSEAVKRFNSDAYIKKELGENAFSSVNQETLDAESYEKAVKVFESYKNQAEQDIKLKGASPAVSTTTFTKFNELAVKEYKAALSAVEDDPTKKGLIRAAFNKIFGEDRDGNKRFGMAEKAELEKAREDIKLLRLAKEDKVNAPLTLKQKEDIETTKTLNANTKANNKIQYFKGTDVPLDTNFQTNKELLKIEKNNFITKVNNKGYEPSLKDINKAVEMGYAIPGFTGLKSLLVNDRQILVDTVAKVKDANSKGLNSWNEGVLNASERRVWGMATSQDLNKLQANEITLNKSKMKPVINVDFNEVMKYQENKNFMATLEKNIETALSDNETFNKLYSENINTETQKYFQKNVIEGALQIQAFQEERGNAINFNDAIKQSIPMQLEGFYQFQEDPFWFSDETHRHEYVDANVIGQMNKKIENNNDAEQITYYANNYKYVQNRYNMIPKPNATFIEDGYEFSVKNISKENETPEYIWDYEYVGTN
tara:strand:- start:3739 stop:5361 length:1623 start_codon:yes stop_codon:yes gene_type:complete